MGLTVHPFSESHEAVVVASAVPSTTCSLISVKLCKIAVLRSDEATMMGDKIK